MKFGWNCSYMAPKSEDVQIFVRIAQEMERTGFQTFWYGEHIIMPDRFDVAQYPYAGFRDMAEPDLSMAFDHEYILKNWHEVAEFEALGIREMVIRPPFKSMHEAYANVGRLAEQLIVREVQG